VGDELSDAEVIQRSLAEPAAFGALFDRHAASMLRFFVRRVGPDDTDNLVGEVFSIAFQRRQTFDSRAGQSARPWLYGIATNLLSHHHRTEARRMRAIAHLATHRTVHDEFEQRSTDRVDSQQHRRQIAEAVSKLDPRERDALLLLAWEELSYAEIASALCIPIGTVRSRINRARTRLRALLTEDDEHT
jgi:RNA polymerase sigma factor (sigma-70 family)